jgi:hypothetical protein
MEKKSNLDNFIGIYDGYLLKDTCNEMISFYENKNKFNKSFSRLQSENAGLFEKKDQTVALNPENIEDWFTNFKILFVNFDIALRHYLVNTGLEDLYRGQSFKYTGFRLQKTISGGGYHVWHIEHYDKEPNRVLAFSIYLNDVNEGGETEFLHQSVRVSPVQGRIVIWPAGFPYVHRGNPPLKGEKYILTSWIIV